MWVSKIEKHEILEAIAHSPEDSTVWFDCLVQDIVICPADNGDDPLLDPERNEYLGMVGELREKLTADPTKRHRASFHPIDETSPSGKVLFQCRVCGRKSATPDKECYTIAMLQAEMRES